MKRWMKTAACILSAVFAAGAAPSVSGMGEKPGLIGLAADAEEKTWECGKNCTAVLDQEGTLTISGTGEMYEATDLVVLDFHPWQRSGNDLYSIKKVVIKEGVTSIGNSAFYYCRHLESVTIPDSVTRIGDYAFEECISLSDITIPDSVTSIGEYAFKDCISLSDITIPDSVTSISDGTFQWCKSLKSITIPESVTSIGKLAFSTCTVLKEVTVPKSVTSIGDEAFGECSQLDSVTFKGDTPPSIGDKSFFFPRWSSYNYRYLQSAKLLVPAADVEKYRNEWSEYAYQIKEDNYKIWICGENCKAELEGDTLTVSGGGAMENYTSDVPAPWHAYRDSIQNAVIEKGITSIGSDAFSGCTGLTSVCCKGVVPPVLKDDAFRSAPDDMKLLVPEASADAYKSAWSSYADQIGGYSLSVLGTWACGENCTAVLESDGTLTISGSGAMADFIIANYIGDRLYAPWYEDFSYTIKNVVIEEGVTSIGECAFDNCTSLQGIAIPESVNKIGKAAFRDCISLTVLTIPATVTGIESQAFAGCLGLKSVKIPENWTGIAAELFADCGLTEFTIPDSVTEIGTYAFAGCGRLTELQIPDSVTVIGSCAFSECSGLTNIRLPEKIRSFDTREAFMGCVSLKEIVIPVGTSIGVHAFSGCTSLSAVTLPTGHVSIGGEAFSRCPSLRKVTILGSAAIDGNIPFGEAPAWKTLILKNPDPSSVDIYLSLDPISMKDLKIYVPEQYVDTYKNHNYIFWDDWNEYSIPGWSRFADQIYADTEYYKTLPGDANCDGSVDVADAVLIMRYAVEDKEAEITDQGVENGDTNHDGKTDADDAALILSYIAKKIRSFE